MAAETPDPIPCSACRGTGTVISRLGGDPHDQPCPWCEGGGVRLADHDAQAARAPGDDAA